MIHCKLSEVGKTVTLALRARAEEHQRPDALLKDQWSADWYATLPTYPDMMAFYERHPAINTTCVVRTHIIDTLTRNFLYTYPQNTLVVELGAGFSTRYYRIAPHRSDWIELDLPEIIACRRKFDSETQAHWFISADIHDPKWLSFLPKHPPDHLLFILEDVLMFMSPPQVRQILWHMRQHFPGARILLDAIHEQVRPAASQMLEAIGLPILWGVQADDLAILGLHVESIHHVMQHFPERWQSLLFRPDDSLSQKSMFVIEAELMPLYAESIG